MLHNGHFTMWTSLFGAGFLPFVTDIYFKFVVPMLISSGTYKQWHYKLKIDESGREPNRSEAFGRDIVHPPWEKNTVNIM